MVTSWTDSFYPLDGKRSVGEITVAKQEAKLCRFGWCSKLTFLEGFSSQDCMHDRDVREFQKSPNSQGIVAGPAQLADADRDRHLLNQVLEGVASYVNRWIDFNRCDGWDNTRCRSRRTAEAASDAWQKSYGNDWSCPGCGKPVFGRRNRCAECEVPVRNNWSCQSCKTQVFGWRSRCKDCGTAHRDVDTMSRGRDLQLRDVKSVEQTARAVGRTTASWQSKHRVGVRERISDSTGIPAVNEEQSAERVAHRAAFVMARTAHKSVEQAARAVGRTTVSWQPKPLRWNQKHAAEIPAEGDDVGCAEGAAKGRNGIYDKVGGGSRRDRRPAATAGRNGFKSNVGIWRPRLLAIEEDGKSAQDSQEAFRSTQQMVQQATA